jgi:hypothetical protein
LFSSSVDEEAKVRAHAVLDGGAGGDETLEAVLPRLVIAADVVFVDVGTVTIVRTEFVLVDVVVVGRHFSVRQEDADGAVATSLESLELAGVVQVFAHELGTGHQGGLKPHLAVGPNVGGGPSLFLGGDAGSAGVTVRRQESVHPQFVVDVVGSTTRDGVDGVDPLKVGGTVHQGTAFGRGAHGVDEFVEVANQLVVVVNADVLAQHPIGEHLDELGGLGAVQAGDQSGLNGLAEVSDEFTVLGLLTDFKLVEVQAELPTKALGSAGNGACIFIKGGDALGLGGFIVFVFRDVDDQLAFVVSNVGGALGDHGLGAAAVFSSS